MSEVGLLKLVNCAYCQTNFVPTWVNSEEEAI
jgi:hypothetical protein